MGSVADWVVACITLLAVFVALFKERILPWIIGPKLHLDFTDAKDCLTITPEVFQVTPASFDKRDVFFARIKVTNLNPKQA